MSHFIGAKYTQYDAYGQRKVLATLNGHILLSLHLTWCNNLYCFFPSFCASLFSHKQIRKRDCFSYPYLGPFFRLISIDANKRGIGVCSGKSELTGCRFCRRKCRVNRRKRCLFVGYEGLYDDDTAFVACGDVWVCTWCFGLQHSEVTDFAAVFCGFVVHVVVQRSCSLTSVALVPCGNNILSPWALTAFDIFLLNIFWSSDWVNSFHYAQVKKCWFAFTVLSSGYRMNLLNWSMWVLLQLPISHSFCSSFSLISLLVFLFKGVRLVMPE